MAFFAQGCSPQKRPASHFRRPCEEVLALLFDVIFHLLIHMGSKVGVAHAGIEVVDDNARSLHGNEGSKVARRKDLDQLGQRVSVSPSR